MTTVAIMQPTYLGWAGYFSMIDEADEFIFLDHVPISRQSWQTRNRIMLRDGTVTWLSIPTLAKHGDVLSTVRIANEHDWRTKHIRSVTQAYAHLEHYEAIRPVVDLMAPQWTSLTAYTKTIVIQLCQTLGIETRFGEQVWTAGLGRIERLGELCRYAGATEYLATPGSTFLAGLEEISPGIPIRWHHYEPQPYEQNGGPFISHLSVVDALVRLGPAETLDLVRAGRKVPV